MPYFIRPDGGYYEGDKAHVLDTAVPQRPTADHTWNGSMWIAPDPTVVADARAADKVDKIDRLQFEVAFDVENRVRVLESKPPINRNQYRNALMAAYKALP